MRLLSRNTALLFALSIFPSAARDPWLWPFASDSIWNTPLGTGAVLVPAGITSAGGVAVDPEILVRTRPGAPERKNFAPAGWEKREGGTQLLGSACFDDDFIVPDARQHPTPNFSGAVLPPDGRTSRPDLPAARGQRRVGLSLRSNRSFRRRHQGLPRRLRDVGSRRQHPPG